MTLKTSKYYTPALSVPFTSRVSLHVRRKMFALFMNELSPHKTAKVLDLGVTSDTDHPESNYFESMYPYKEYITCAGVEDGAHLTNVYPGIQYRSIRPHEPLPFSDRQFDIVFSNAVIEHAGDREQQKEFVREILRVGKAFFVTTPNRWFPIEMHTSIPLMHFLPVKIHRFFLDQVGEHYWSREENLNLFDSRSLVELFPSDIVLRVKKVRLLGFASNLVAFGWHAGLEDPGLC